MQKQHKILAITLARGGSKRVPKKNITQINNKPLLQYTVDEVKQSKYIDKYIISTDDEEIINVCKTLNVDYHIRPIELAQDTTSSASSINNVLEVYNKNNEYDIIVEIMCTNPLKNVKDIDGCIEKLINADISTDCVVSVVRLWDNHPSRVKFIENDQLNDFYPEIPESRRQDLHPPAYARNGSIYAFWTKTIINYNNRLGKICRPYIMPEERTINIDEPIDLELAKLLMKNETDIEYCSRLDAF